MEKSGFFNSVNGDRKYKAEDWSNYFKRFVTNGIFPVPSTNLQVMANSDMTITVKAGAGWINGYIYENTSELILPVDAADGVLSRIDRVALKYDTVAREIKAIVKKGSFSSSPVAPALQRDSDAYELGIADISIAAGAASIEQVNITDIRLNTELCGIVNSLIQADTTTLLNQYESGMQAKMLEFQEDFEAWFATIQDILDEDTAGNLLNLINANSAALTDHEEAADPHEQYALDTDLATLQGEVTSHKADIANKTDAAKGAALIGMLPIVGLTGDNVRTAISNLFTFANDGKTNIAGVIGSPALSSDTFATLVTRLQTLKNNLVTVMGVGSGTSALNALINTTLDSQRDEFANDLGAVTSLSLQELLNNTSGNALQHLKNLLATNLTNKGLSAAGTETLASLVGKIANIELGKKTARGLMTVSTSSSFLVASGLDFTPNVIVGVMKVADIIAIYDSRRPGGSIVSLQSVVWQAFTSSNGYVSPGTFKIPVSYQGEWYWFASE